MTAADPLRILPVIKLRELKGFNMKRVSLDSTTPAVKEFISQLPLSPEGIELELEGQVVCTVIPPLSEMTKSALIERARELVRRARERNKNVPSSVLEREVREAVAQVRRRKET